MPKTIAQVQSEIDRTEEKIAKLKVKSEEKAKLKKMQARLFKMKHQREIEIGKQAAKGLTSLAKALGRGYQRLQKYSNDLEARDKAAKRKR